MLINFALFQIGWFVCVLGGANGLAWLGPVFVLLAIAVEWRRVANRRGYLIMVALVTLLGGVTDAGQTAVSNLNFPGGALPMWMVSLWALFATTLTGCMAWMQRRLWLAAILGAVAGPLCYAGGERLEALSLGPNAWWSVAIEWAVLTPLALAIASRVARPVEAGDTVASAAS